MLKFYGINSLIGGNYKGNLDLFSRLLILTTLVVIVDDILFIVSYDIYDISYSNL